MEAKRLESWYSFIFDIISSNSTIYRVDDLILEIEYSDDKMILHQALKIVEKESGYGVVRDVEQILF